MTQYLLYVTLADGTKGYLDGWGKLTPSRNKAHRFFAHDAATTYIEKQGWKHTNDRVPGTSTAFTIPYDTGR